MCLIEIISSEDCAEILDQHSQFLLKPSTFHYNVACRFQWYPKHCPGQGLFFPRNSDIHMGFSDSDWTSCVYTRRLVSRSFFFIGSLLISWRTRKKIPTSSLSSRVEYRPLAVAPSELQWILYLLCDLQVTCKKPQILYCDYQSAIHITANRVFHKITKHFKIDCHLNREKN